MLTVEPHTPDNVVVGHATGRLTHDDYGLFRGHVEEMIREHGSVRVMLDLEDFHGWDLHAAWDDLRLGLEHAGKFERCAILGDQSWEKWMIRLAQPFITVKFFDRREREAAWRWLMQPAGANGESGLSGTIRHAVKDNPALGLFAVGVFAGFLLGRMGSSRTRVMV